MIPPDEGQIETPAVGMGTALKHGRPGRRVGRVSYHWTNTLVSKVRQGIHAQGLRQKNLASGDLVLQWTVRLSAPWR
jgi:hypothetical protein